MGLAAKNAILIVEFAEQQLKAGKGVVQSAVEAAHLRLRPILMTSLAFVFGVFPLAIAAGPGAGGPEFDRAGGRRRHIDRDFLAIFFVPLFFVVVMNLFARTSSEAPGPAPAGQEA